MDKVFLKDLVFFAYHGVTDEEKKTGRQFKVNIVVSLDDSTINDSDDLKQTVNYQALSRISKEVSTAASYNLVETVASQIASQCLNELKLVKQVTVRVEKLNPPIGEIAASAGVEITRRREP